MKTSQTPKSLRQSHENKRKFRFVIRKYVVATSVEQALKHEHKAPVHEVLVSNDQDDRATANPIGFEYYAPEEWASYGPHLKKRKPKHWFFNDLWHNEAVKDPAQADQSAQ